MGTLCLNGVAKMELVYLKTTVCVCVFMCVLVHMCTKVYAYMWRPQDSLSSCCQGTAHLGVFEISFTGLELTKQAKVVGQ